MTYGPQIVLMASSIEIISIIGMGGSCEQVASFAARVNIERLQFKALKPSQCALRCELALPSIADLILYRLNNDGNISCLWPQWHWLLVLVYERGIRN